MTTPTANLANNKKSNEIKSSQNSSINNTNIKANKSQSNGKHGKLWSIRLIELLVSFYDFITLPIYYLIYQPWKVKALATRPRARQVDEFVWESIDSEGVENLTNQSIFTLDELFRTSVATYGPKNALGVRKILAVEYKDDGLSTTKPNGQQANGNNSNNKNGQIHIQPKTPTLEPGTQKKRTISKYVLDDKYSWYTYNQVGQMVAHLSTGLVSICNDSLMNSDNSRKLLIIGDTCMQWFLIAHACFRNNITLVTSYTTLDDEAILHTIRQTEVKILVVSQKFAPRLHKIVQEALLVDTIIVLDEPLPGEENQISLLKPLLERTSVRRIIAYTDLIARGKEIPEQIIEKPTPDDVAVLMYTSGSTGKAKGVMLTQKCIIYTALSFVGPGNLSADDRFLGYLPLGHVLELSAECIFMRNGSTIGYSSPMTLTSQSPYIQKGAKGDAELIKPTIFAAVPLVLDRLKVAVKSAIKSRGAFYDQLVNEWLISYKRYWWDRYFEAPILNYLICRKFNLILGGKVRAICSGGAALSAETHEYLRHVGNYTLIQGYGLTETSAAASFCDIHDRRYNVVGSPYPIVQIKLVDWSDYSVHDKPYPRGEIIVGGDPIAGGYYKMPELTEECFYTDDKTGVRYFKTGDIGLMLPDGVLKIIDRKKDLVKPLCGEYISLSEIEATLATNNLVENICVYCSQFSNYVVAIVRPNKYELRLLAQALIEEQSDDGDNFRMSLSMVDSNNLSIQNVSWEDLCKSPELTKRVLAILRQVGAEQKLKRNEIPSNIKIVADEWTAENGFMTASFKLRRRELERFYSKDIECLYAEIGENIQLSN